MQIANEFSLDLPLEQAWPLLTDLERVAPAMPGVRVDGVDGRDLRATMRVKVGPITVAYRATVTLASADEATRTAVLRASGREVRGRGTVDATVTAALRPAGSSATAVALTTDLAVTGRVAQFGGGVMSEVADRLLRQFAQRLVAELERPAPAAADGAATAVGGAAGATATATAPSQAAADVADRNGHAPDAAARTAAATAAAADDAPLDLGKVAGSALLPGGPAATAFLGGLLGALVGALAAALLLRGRR